MKSFEGKKTFHIYENNYLKWVDTEIHTAIMVVLQGCR